MVVEFDIYGRVILRLGVVGVRSISPTVILGRGVVVLVMTVLTRQIPPTLIIPVTSHSHPVRSCFNFIPIFFEQFRHPFPES